MYIPEPGSPLRIPIIDIHHGGRKGDARTVQTTEDAVDAIEKECRVALEGTGATFERTFERYFEPKSRGRRGGSYVDGLIRIQVGGITIDFVADTYTPKVDGVPTLAEKNRYIKVEPNMKNHAFVVRVPKAWTMGQQLNKERLSAVTRELCEQIKNMLGKGEFPPGKEKAFIDKLLKELIKPKPKRGPDPREPLEPRE